MPFAAVSESTPALTPPSGWLRRWLPQLQAGQTALDLACGGGRNSRALLQQGLKVTGVDRDAQALAQLPASMEALCADLESGPWPLVGRHFDLVLVCNYLWRPRLPELLSLVAPGGWLIYETFALGQERLGRPRNPDFLLRPGELLTLCQGKLHVLAYEDGIVNGTRIQRVAARALEPAQAQSAALLESPAFPRVPE
ncbi:SAM-dependent methyltransferase [Inhella inkyongensis]|uniref:SAM-dependent methyltransferase n=1 Tax=Inhella inkyongensis TaxID=392593 RepID=A0A840S5Z2_9BURK|nr:class I SAM-dependent methyltransferase [Inhella inkyongensis]MBB5204031.1 SAM-dependent methyltransferase [Inhella inkyongensis]